MLYWFESKKLLKFQKALATPMKPDTLAIVIWSKKSTKFSIFL